MITRRPPGLRRLLPAAAPRHGFTLIELLVVIAVIAVLAALAMPVLMEALGQADRTKCGSNLHQIGQAFSMYTTNNDLYLPTTPRGSTQMVGGAAGNWSSYAISDRPLNPYCGTDNFELFHCPADGGRQSDVWGHVDSLFWARGTSYTYLAWDNQLNDPTNKRAGKQITYYKKTAGITHLMGDDCGHAFGFEMQATGQDPYTAYARWHDPEIKCNILFMDVHVNYIQMQYGDSWPGFSWR